METKYQKVKDFELNLNIRSYKYFSKQFALLDEMMELYLEPLDKIISGCHNEEAKSPAIVLISRIFNDFECSRLLLQNGQPEQAAMPMRDALEGMMLIKLFCNDYKLALRWMKDLKEYRISHVKKRLDELKVDCPEYALYGTLSTLTHANLLSVASRVTETTLTNNSVLRTYHFGGINNPSWIGLVLNNLLIYLLLILLSVHPLLYLPNMSDFNEWWNRVNGLLPKLQEFLGDALQFEEFDKTGGGDTERARVFKRLKLAKVQAILYDGDMIAADKGFPDA